MALIQRRISNESLACRGAFWPVPWQRFQTVELGLGSNFTRLGEYRVFKPGMIGAGWLGPGINHQLDGIGEALGIGQPIEFDRMR